ncbi:hypothetical protein [Nostoc sp. FACHB-145]|nr:hypothetical protein [Nostoc sp. FACHB-145]
MYLIYSLHSPQRGLVKQINIPFIPEPATPHPTPKVSNINALRLS